MSCAICHDLEGAVQRFEVLHRAASRAAAAGMKSGIVKNYLELRARENAAKMKLDLARAELKQHRRQHHLKT